MALSTTLLTLFDDIVVCDGLSNAIRFNKGLRDAVYIFRDKVVNQRIARIMGLSGSIDINLLIEFS